MTEPNYRLPVKREPSPLPAPLWQQAAPAVIRTAALVAVGVVGQWALRSAAKKAVAMPFSGGRKTRAITAREPDVIAVSETVIMRRVTVRRGP